MLVVACKCSFNSIRILKHSNIERRNSICDFFVYKSLFGEPSIKKLKNVAAELFQKSWYKF